jgi:LPXTG-motif cell wall-anchored protein
VTAGQIQIIAGVLFVIVLGLLVLRRKSKKTV